MKSWTVALHLRRRSGIRAGHRGKLWRQMADLFRTHLLTFALALISSTVHAEFMTGRALLYLLNAQDTASHQRATGYIAGVVDFAMSDPDHEQSRFCFAVPTGTSLDSLVGVVHRFLQREAHGTEQTDLDDLAASGLVRVALAAKFACSRQT